MNDRKTKEIVWPALPAEVFGVAGPISVRVVAGEEMAGRDTLGYWDPCIREVWIRDDLKPHVSWHTLVHELYHAKLYDMGAQNYLSNKLEELLCDGLSTARMAILKDHIKEYGPITTLQIQTLLSV